MNVLIKRILNWTTNREIVLSHGFCHNLLIYHQHYQSTQNASINTILNRTISHPLNDCELNTLFSPPIRIKTKKQ